MKTKYLNCTMIHSKKKRNLDEIKKAIKRAERKDSELYNMKIKPYDLILFDTLKEYKKKAHMVVSNACIMYKKIYLFEVKSGKEKHFPISFTLYHELNHLFYLRRVGHFKPEWLSEGVALFDQREYNPPKKRAWKKYFSAIKKPERHLLTKTRHLKKTEERNKFFIISYLCTAYLEKKFGKTKLIDFLEQIPKQYNDKVFWNRFKKYFKLSKKQLVINSLK